MGTAGSLQPASTKPMKPERYVPNSATCSNRNEDLQRLADGEAAFVDYMLSHLPKFPPQYVDIKRVNAGLLAPTDDESSELELGRNICALSHAYQQS